ncbi:MAG TPA: PAS domain-containing sensor histidine kinase [Mycobacteriales bacterium]
MSVEDAYALLPDAVLVLDPAGTIQSANPAAHRLLGEALQGRPVSEAGGLCDDLGRDWWACEEAARAMAGVRAVPERRLRLPDGQAVLLTAAYIRVGGQLESVVIALRSTRARDRIERTHADLISTVAHELRSPLTSVKGFTATMLAKWDRFGDDEKKQMLAWINGDADRVTRLLAELLDVSRIDAGRLELHTQVVDIAGVVRKAFAGRIAAGEPEAGFVLNEQGRPPEMWVDPDKVEQIVGNLVENAVRHGSGTVTVTVVADDAGATVSIDDEGDGVPPDVAPRIFSKFFRGRANRGGTGLGLYIVRGLVEAHGGTVGVETAPSGGARFRFRLPAGSPPFAEDRLRSDPRHR